MSVQTVEVRRIIVAHLTALGMGPAKIASELGVSRETVRRDVHTVRAQAEPEPDPAEARDVADHVQVGPEGLTLPASIQLGRDLRLIAASHRQPVEAVVEELIHQRAEAIRTAWSPRVEYGAEKTVGSCSPGTS